MSPEGCTRCIKQNGDGVALENSTEQQACDDHLAKWLRYDVMAVELLGINLFICAPIKQWLERDTFKLFLKIQY